jgi:hypothetical protein
MRLMPCRDYADDDDNRQRFADLQARLDRATRLLCSALGGMADHSGLDPEVAQWWIEHQEADQARRKKEREEDARRRVAAELRIKSAERDLETARRVLEELRRKPG